MIVDSSALVAFIEDEPEAERLEAIFRTTDHLHMGAATLAESFIVITKRHGPIGRAMVDGTRQKCGITILGYTAEHAELAVQAHLAYGKGRHPAKLNLGDCMTYAVAKAAREPLLMVGNNFPQTDLVFADGGLVGEWPV